MFVYYILYGNDGFKFVLMHKQGWVIQYNKVFFIILIELVYLHFKVYTNLKCKQFF